MGTLAERLEQLRAIGVEPAEPEPLHIEIPPIQVEVPPVESKVTAEVAPIDATAINAALEKFAKSNSRDIQALINALRERKDADIGHYLKVVTDLAERTQALIDVLRNLPAPQKAGPMRYAVNRDENGFIQSVDTVPIPKAKKTETAVME